MPTKTRRSFLIYGLSVLFLLLAVFFYFQQEHSKSPTAAQDTLEEVQNKLPQIAAPDFRADSAFAFLKKQVDFGPRVPNTPAHKACSAWLVKEFKRFGFTVIEQKFQAPYYKGGIFDGTNIIAQYNPEAQKRICIAAHWDCRNEADQDTKDRNKPIDGADDGASGVSVILEIARTLHETPVNVGVDLICFDLEDNGQEDSTAINTWCIGSQYWAAHLHRPAYSPYYAILLDMVGAKGARFYKEGNSMEVAPTVVEKVWRIANTLGYNTNFMPGKRPAIMDDHYFVSRNAGIPMIDIVNMPSDKKLFGDHHHTHADNLSIIDINVLKAVGQTMVVFIYQMNAGVL